MQLPKLTEQEKQQFRDKADALIMNDGRWKTSGKEASITLTPEDSPSPPKLAVALMSRLQQKVTGTTPKVSPDGDDIRITHIARYREAARDAIKRETGRAA